MGFGLKLRTPPRKQKVYRGPLPQTVGPILLVKRGVFRNMAHWGTSQQPNIFVNEGQAVWAEVYRSMGRGEAEARVWTTGHLVPMTGGGVPW